MSRLRRFREWWTLQKVVVLAVVGAVAVALVGILWQPRASYEPGDTVRESAWVSVPSEVTRWLGRLPFGEVRVRTDVGRKGYFDGDTETTSGRARWVEIDWTVVPTPPSPVLWPGATTAQRSEPASTLTLVAGGDRYPVVKRLLSSGDSGRTMLMVADADDLHFVLRSGGVERRVPIDPGSRSRDSQTIQECKDGGDTERMRVEVGCTLDVERTPYVAGLGWAPRGRDWLIVDASVKRSGGATTSKRGVVGEWSPRDGVEPIDYVVRGAPSLTVRVSRTDRTEVGAPTVRRGASVALGVRAYAVPATESVEVTMTYRATGVPQPDPDETVPDAAPRRATVKLQERFLSTPGDR